MRLLRVGEHGELSFTPNLIEDIPKYAILSHTWGADGDEVALDDIKNGSCGSKPGHAKIRFCAEQACKDGLSYIWVDTCCIDQTNQAELSEAIVSMYRWYQNAVKCYAYLEDVTACKRDNEGVEASWKSAFQKSRWFTRGWTLQELLAPKQVEFYSREWKTLGDKCALQQEIHEATQIPVAAIQGFALSGFTIDERMRWAIRRSTKRPEDKWYCLLGIFEVYMTPMYGEGENAFVRLKDEIGKSYLRTLDAIGQPHTPNTHNLLDDSIRVTPDPKDIVSEQDIRKDLLTSMSFDQMDSRRSTIKNAYSTTCVWLLKHTVYLDWIDPDNFHQHSGFLWISGKPGAGKSTLLKFTHTNAKQTKPAHEILISFFFNARGDQLEKSITGMYRALLFQLLKEAPDLQFILDQFCHPSGEYGRHPTWTVEVLCELFSSAVMSLGRRQLRCFIDALDECDEDEVRGMIDFFEELSEAACEAGIKLYICFASRHYPTIEIRIGQQLILEDETGHSQDLAKYVRNHLRAGKGRDVEKIRKQIEDKANGVFMWAVLVVPVLNKEFQAGRIFAVKKRLDEVPAELSNLFKHILKRDKANLIDFLLCLQWILFASRPLKREEFYFAMVAGLDPEPGNMTEWDPEHVTEEDMSRYVLNASKGLAELTRSKTPTVQFIHESVRDFLIKDKGLRELWPEYTEHFDTLSHDRLKECCINYLKVDLPEHLVFDRKIVNSSSGSLKERRINLTSKFPFLEYASRNVLYHANEAVRGISQNEFLESFDLETWIKVSNLLEPHDIRLHTLKASLIYILAEYNFSQLIRVKRQQGVMMGAPIQKERYQWPFFAASLNGHEDAVRALLQQDKARPQEDWAANPEFGRMIPFKKGTTPLSWAIEMGYEVLVEALIASPDADLYLAYFPLSKLMRLAIEKGYERTARLLIDKYTQTLDTGVTDKTALHSAAQYGRQGIVQLLLNKNFSTEAIDLSGQTPLHIAALNGHEVVVQLLLDRNSGSSTATCHGQAQRVNINVKDNDGWTALSWAAMNGHKNVVQLLLAQDDIEINSMDKCLRTPLHLAAPNDCGGKEVVKLLLDTGKAQVDAKDSMGRTPLSLSAWAGAEANTELLLATNEADPDTRDDYGTTPLWLAVEAGNMSVVCMLLSDGRIHPNIQDNEGWSPLSVAVKQIKDGPSVGAFRKLQHRPTLLERQKRGQLMTDKAIARDCSTGKHHNPDLPNLVHGESMVRLLLASEKIDPDSKDINGRTALSWAAGYNVSEVVHALLALERVDPNIKDLDGQAPLSWAAKSGADGAVELLLASNKVEPEERDNYGRTPLRLAAEAGHLKVVRLLLAETGRVDPNTKDDVGRTPLSVLVTKVSHPSKIELSDYQMQLMLLEQHRKKRLAEARGMIFVPTTNSHEAAYSISKTLNASIVLALLTAPSIDLDAKDHRDRTPLSWAAEADEGEGMEMLLATKKVDPNSRDRDGRTPISWAASKGANKAVQMLLNTANVEPDAQDNKGRSPLSWAAGEGEEKVVESLLQCARVDRNAKDQYNQTPLDWARKNRAKAIILILTTANWADEI